MPGCNVCLPQQCLFGGYCGTGTQVSTSIAPIYISTTHSMLNIGLNKVHQCCRTLLIIPILVQHLLCRREEGHDLPERGGLPCGDRGWSNQRIKMDAESGLQKGERVQKEVFGRPEMVPRFSPEYRAQFRPLRNITHFHIAANTLWS